jgi:hypothetical protein
MSCFEEPVTVTGHDYNCANLSSRQMEDMGLSISDLNRFREIASRERIRLANQLTANSARDLSITSLHRMLRRA